ncbi:flagellar basal body rod protein FlgB [bacterium]|nr:flagellar basal body rod protein FlgB [bacterium]
MNLFDASVTQLQRAMDLRMDNQRVIASNLANVDTPGYKARRMDFEASMAQALTDAANPAVIQESTDPALTLDGNNIDMDRELSDMSRNKTMYNLTAQILAAKFRQLGTVFEQK